LVSFATNKIKTHLDIRSKKHYIQGEFGVRLEDDIVIAENGGELPPVRMERIEPIQT
jgi:Xaa-Pro aminopeptidase